MVVTKKLIFSYFPTPNETGKALHGIFVPTARKLRLTVNEHWNATTKEYAQACWDDDVVLDGPVADRGFHNYELAVPIPMHHALVVSQSSALCFAACRSH
jgi:hypothetical protein